MVNCHTFRNLTLSQFIVKEYQSLQNVNSPVYFWQRNFFTNSYYCSPALTQAKSNAKLLSLYNFMWFSGSSESQCINSNRLARLPVCMLWSLGTLSLSRRFVFRGALRTMICWDCLLWMFSFNIRSVYRINIKQTYCCVLILYWFFIRRSVITTEILIVVSLV